MEILETIEESHLLTQGESVGTSLLTISRPQSPKKRFCHIRTVLAPHPFSPYTSFSHPHTLEAESSVEQREGGGTTAIAPLPPAMGAGEGRAMLS